MHKIDFLPTKDLAQKCYKLYIWIYILFLQWLGELDKQYCQQMDSMTNFTKWKLGQMA